MRYGLTLLLLLGMAVAQQVELGAGSYVTRRPADIIDPPPTIFRSGWEGPAPTNRWWSSLLWTAFSETLYAGPLSFQARPDGLAFGYPRLMVDEEGFAMPFIDDLTVGLEHFTAEAARVTRFDDWTVTARWEAAEDERFLEATIGQGLPYAYLTLGGERAQLRFRETPAVWLAAPGRLGVTVAGRHYAVFYQGQGQLDGTYLRLLVSPGALLSVAALPEASEALLERFAAYAFHRPTDSRVDWRWLPDEGLVEVTFTLATQTPQGEAGGALMGLYPLHWKHTTVPLTDLHYQTPRGVMKLAETNRFTIRLPYTGVLPVLPLAEEAAPLLQELLAEYVERGSFFPLFFGQIRRPDSYADGKSFGRLAALLPIAEQLGEAEAATTLLEAMKERLALWFTADDGLPLLYYNANWGALIAAPTSHGLDQSLNDHAFHYGYFLQAAASIAERDPAWVADWGPMVNLLIRNTAGARDDPMFPFLRALDPYPGHGWASGSGLFGRGSNLESSSEAINFAAGLIRWAEAVSDAELLELGIYLYATQTAAVWEYWFAAGGNFPPEFLHTAIGILWGDGGAYRTWWTLDPEAIHGINFLPITGSSLYLGRDPDFVLSNYRHMTGGRERPHYWPDIALSYLALADPEAALALWSRELRPEFGETRARTYHWLRSLARYGTPVAITADTAQFAVLSRGDLRTYLAFNPSETPRTVRFSDGTVLLAAPGTLTIKESP